MQNDAALVNAAIQDITMNVPDDLALVSLEGYPDKQIQINYGGQLYAYGIRYVSNA